MDTSYTKDEDGLREMLTIASFQIRESRLRIREVLSTRTHVMAWFNFTLPSATAARLWYKKLSIFSKVDYIGVSCTGEETRYSLPHWSCWEGGWPAFQLSPQSCVSGAHLRLQPATLYQLDSLPQEPFLYPNSNPNLFLSNPPATTHKKKKRQKEKKRAYRQIDAIQDSLSLLRKGWL